MPKLTFAPNLDTEFARQKREKDKTRKQIQREGNKARRKIFHGK